MRAKAHTQQAASAAPVLTGLLRRQCACGQHTIAGGECAECGKHRDDAPSLVREALSAAREPLDPEIRAFMEPRFGGDFTRVPARLPSPRELAIGRADDPLESAAEAAADRAMTQDPREPAADFSGVMIHRDARAAAAARAVNARAFTLGSHIVLAAGEYQPQSSAGRRLLAHELAHVMQQTGPTIRRKVATDDAAPKAPDAATNANDRQPDNPAGDEKDAAAKAAPDDKTQTPSADKPKTIGPAPDSQQQAAGAMAKDKGKAGQASDQQDKAADAAKPAEPQTLGDLSAGGLALVDESWLSISAGARRRQGGGGRFARTCGIHHQNRRRGERFSNRPVWAPAWRSESRSPRRCWEKSP